MATVVPLDPQAKPEAARSFALREPIADGSPVVRPVVAADPGALVEAYASAWNAGDCPLVLNPALPAAVLEGLVANVGRGPAPFHGHLLCTSGTTGGGVPKVFAFEAQAPAGNARAHLASLGIEAGTREATRERFLLPLPLSHSFGLVAGLHGVAACDATLFVFQAAPDPTALLDGVAQHEVTTLYLHPTLARLLVRSVKRRGPRSLPSLRRVSVGSASFGRSELVELGRALPGVEVFFTYGLTEMGPRVTTFAGGVEGARALALGDLPSSVPIGVPIPGVSCGIVEGHLVVESPFAAAGLWRNGSLAPLPAGAFRTEDLAEQLPSGDFAVLGRSDATIVSGGINVYPDDLERIAGSTPGVAASCVVPEGSALYGAIATMLVESDGTVEDAALVATLTARLREGLPETHLPRKISVVPALPKTSMGKVIRNEASLLAAAQSRPTARGSA